MDERCRAYTDKRNPISPQAVPLALTFRTHYQRKKVSYTSIHYSIPYKLSNIPNTKNITKITFDNRFDMEVHLVHESDDNRTAVVGITYKIGRPDSFISMVSYFFSFLHKYLYILLHNSNFFSCEILVEARI